MILCDKKLREYVLLTNYRENIYSRGFLLRVSFVSLEQIEKNSWYMQIPDDERPRVRSLMQMDIVSKIMMYVEDLAILAESIHLNRDFYELLMDKNVDIGRKTGEFIHAVHSFTYEKLSQIMSYADIDQIGSDEECKGLLKKHFDYNVERVRRMLREIGSFSSKANHSLYKRFKHAGMPIFSNSVHIPPQSGPLASFEVFNVISDGIDPVKDIVIIPYSQRVMKRYEEIINKLQTLLLELTENRLECLKRNIPGMIPRKYREDLFSSQEKELMQIKIDNFYSTHPIKEISTKLHSDVNVEKESIQWYLEEKV